MIRILTRNLPLNSNLIKLNSIKSNSNIPFSFLTTISKKNQQQQSLLLLNRFYSSLPSNSIPKPEGNSSNNPNNSNKNQSQQQDSNQNQSTIDQSNSSVTQRLKALFRTNGWSALVIYLALSLADFSLTFLLIYAVGADKVREAEDWVLEALGWRRQDGEPGKIKRAVEEWKGNHNGKKSDDTSLTKVVNSSATPTTPSSSSSSSDDSGYSAIATTAVLAYAIHKTLLLPVRLGITVAITPRIVRRLQAWGWKVGYAGVVGAGSGSVGATVASGGTNV